jgi:hypothetical protein
MLSSWILKVQTRLSGQLDLTFRDRADLVAQLAQFRARGLANPHFLHEFRNEHGALLAFISKAYISHRVDPPHLDFV